MKHRHLTELFEKRTAYIPADVTEQTVSLPGNPGTLIITIPWISLSSAPPSSGFNEPVLKVMGPVSMELMTTFDLRINMDEYKIIQFSYPSIEPCSIELTLMESAWMENSFRYRVTKFIES